MIPNFDLSNVITTAAATPYVVTATDQAAYSGFFVTGADVVTVGDGTASLALTLAANEVVALNGTITSITTASINKIVFVL